MAKKKNVFNEVEQQALCIIGYALCELRKNKKDLIAFLYKDEINLLIKKLDEMTDEYIK